MTQQDSTFDRLIKSVGNDGPFQNRFNFIFICMLSLFATLPYMNIIFALTVPDHWCDVPGSRSNFSSLEEWKSYHIPRENTTSKEGYSKCKMYNRTIHNEEPDYVPEIIDCQYGWEFDTEWYSLTVPVEGQWVCHDELRVTNAFVFVRAGELVGTFIFGQLADSIGRRPVFFMTILLLVVGRLLMTVTTAWVIVFFLVLFLGSLPSTMVFQGPLIIAMEITKNENRAQISMLQCIFWTAGLCMTPLVMWAVGNWVYYMYLTTLPCVIFLMLKNYLIESPRWLASRGQTKECIRALKQIAKVNKTKVPEDAAVMLLKTTQEPDHAYGVLGLFSSWRLVKNSLLLIFNWSVTVMVYFILILNTTNLAGNPFMNFFWQSLAELPGYIIGRYASDHFGRRWTSLISFVGTFIGCICLMFIIQDESMATGVVLISVFLKFSISFAFYVLNLQSLEVYPTCIRQTGMSIGGITANAVGMLTPYIIFLGTQYNATYPYVISTVMSFLAMICVFLLPETLNQRLPETLADAAEFGADQNFWGVVIRKSEDIESVSELEIPLKAK